MLYPKEDKENRILLYAVSARLRGAPTPRVLGASRVAVMSPGSPAVSMPFPVPPACPAGPFGAAAVSP